MRRLPITLAAFGVTVLLVGAALITYANSAMHPAEVPLTSAEYIGSNTCFTCHKDQPPKWEGALHPIIIQDAVANPAAVNVEMTTGEQSRPVDSGGDTRPFTLEELAFNFTLKDNLRQRYVMKTDDGYKALPRRWADWMWMIALS